MAGGTLGQLGRAVGDLSHAAADLRAAAVLLSHQGSRQQHLPAALPGRQTVHHQSHAAQKAAHSGGTAASADLTHAARDLRDAASHMVKASALLAGLRLPAANRGAAASPASPVPFYPPRGPFVGPQQPPFAPAARRNLAAEEAEKEAKKKAWDVAEAIKGGMKDLSSMMWNARANAINTTAHGNPNLYGQHKASQEAVYGAVGRNSWVTAYTKREALASQLLAAAVAGDGNELNYLGKHGARKSQAGLPQPEMHANIMDWHDAAQMKVLSTMPGTIESENLRKQIEAMSEHLGGLLESVVNNTKATLPAYG